jgi:hypothetical protein
MEREQGAKVTVERTRMQQFRGVEVQCSHRSVLSARRSFVGFVRSSPIGFIRAPLAGWLVALLVGPVACRFRLLSVGFSGWLRVSFCTGPVAEPSRELDFEMDDMFTIFWHWCISASSPRHKWNCSKMNARGSLISRRNINIWARFVLL